MRKTLFLAGAAGAIGRRLAPLLVSEGMVGCWYDSFFREGRVPA